MIFSYTQISQYLRCPRSYRLRYLDGWQERDTRAGMVFGRCFEQALAALFVSETQKRSSSETGERTEIKICNTKMVTCGIESSIRVFTSCSVLRKMSAFGSVNRKKTFR